MTKNRSTALAALSLGVGIVTLLIFVSRAQTTDRQEHLPGAAERRGTIAWRVKRAKINGNKKVTLSPVMDTPAIVRSLDEALSQYTVVVAQLVGKKSYVATDDSLTTWHKFKVQEVLSEPVNQVCPGCLKNLAGPPDMLPLAPDEVLLPTNGGAVIVDGIQVESKDTDLGNHFTDSQKYLLFISLHQSKRVGRLRLGSDGVFVINSADQITPINSTKTPLNQYLQLRFSASLNALRGFLQAVK